MLVPGLVMLGAAQHVAHATSLVAIVVIAPAALVGFALEGAVSVGPALVLAAGGISGAWAGAAVMGRISATRLRQIFALLLLVVAARLLVPSEIVTGGGALALDGARLAALAALGVTAGVLSAVMGVGGGIVLIPALVLGFGFSAAVAEGTSLLFMIPTALVGAVRHARSGYTDWRLGLMLGAGGVLGALVGAQLALALPAAVLQRLFAVFLAVTALRLLWSSRQVTPARPQRSLQ